VTTERQKQERQLQAWRAEMRELMDTWEYAFGIGHGCSVGRHPQTEAVVKRVWDLRALIREHSS